MQQLNAIDLLVAGSRDREVSEAVGVNRVTVSRWRNHDPLFQAELNRSRREIWSSSTDRLRALLPHALDRLESELGGGPNGWKVALALLGITGLDFSSPKTKQSLGTLGIGSTDPEGIIKAHAHARRPDRFEELRGDAVTGSELAVAEAELAQLLQAP